MYPTPSRRTRRITLVATATAAIALLCGACSDSNTTTGDETTQPSATTTTSTTVSAVQTPTSSPSVPKFGDGNSEPCASVPARNSTRQDVYLHYGSLTCAQAVTAFTRYFTDTTLPLEGSGGHATFDGYSCITTSFGNLADLGYTAQCVRDADGANAITVDQGQRPPPHEQDPAKYVVPNSGDPDNPTYYFASLSGKWLCGISATAAGCSGAMPSNAADVPSPFSGPHPPTRPNLVEMKAGQAPRFGATEDAAYANRDAKALDYGDTLSVHGFTCSVDFTAGVTCANGAHKFTVAADSYNFS